MKILTLSIFVLFTVGLLNAQETKPSFLTKTNQHSISAEFAALSYSYAHKFKPNVTFGVRVQVGLGWRYLLTNPSMYYQCDQCTEPRWVKVKPSSDPFVDLIELQLFYRSTISKHLYYDIGPYATIGVWGELYLSINTGLEGSVYYRVKKLYFGARIMAGIQSIGSTSNYFGLYVIPLVVGFNF
jgi:hypothetical protein